MTLALSTQGIAGASGFPHDPELIGSTDQTVTYAGDTAMRVVLPKVRDGSSDTVDDGWAVSVLVTGGGALELIDFRGHRVLLVPGYGQAGLVANDDTVDGTYGGWTEAHVWPNVQVEDTTYQARTYASLASDPTPSVLHARELDIQSTVAITYLDDGVVGQRVTLTFSGGTNSTIMIVRHGSSFSLLHGVDFRMSTGESVELHMFSTDAWTEIGRNRQFEAPIASVTTSLINADNGHIFTVSGAASLLSSLPGGYVGQVVTFYSTVADGGITNSTRLQLSSGADFAFGAVDESISLRQVAAGTWVQLDAQADS